MLKKIFVFFLTVGLIFSSYLNVRAAQDNEAASQSETAQADNTTVVDSGNSSEKVTVNDLLGVDLEAEKQNMSKIKALGQDSDTVSPNNVDSDTFTVTTMSVTGESGALPLPEKMIKSFQFDPYSGSGNMSIPIYTPTGRAGVQPNVALTYSHRGSNDLLGVGWSINFGAIERSTKNGVPKYDSTDTFICTLGGGSFELVNIGGGEYRAQVEGAFMRFTFVDPFWEVKDKQGNTYYFGLDTLLEDDSRVEDNNKVFRWYLSEVKDIHENYYFVRNFEDGSFEILYTGQPGTDRDALNAGTQNFAHKITVAIESTDRDDIVMSSKSGIDIWRRRRLASIEVRSNDTLQRKYVFGYDYSQRTGRSLLESVTEYGSDGVTAMPALTFEYHEDTYPVYDIQTAFGDIENGDTLFNIRFNSWYEIGDVNIYTLYPNYNGNSDYGYFNTQEGDIVPWGPKHTDHVYNSGGIYWYQDTPYGNLDFSGPVDSAMKAWTYLFLRDQEGPVYFDFNQSDVGALYINGTYGNVLGSGTYTLNQGYNLIEFTAYNQNSLARLKLVSNISTQVDVMNSTQLILPQLSGDFNGDGLADLATFSSVEGKVLVSLSQGETFLPKTEWISNFGVDSQIFLGDFNGDGKVDLGAYNPDTDNVHVALSTGSGFTDAGIWQNIVSYYPIVSAGDVNGDGLSDLVMFFYNNVNYCYYQVYYSDGTSFYTWNYNDQYAGALNDNLFTGDFNGDGLSDFARFTKSTGNWEIRYNLTDSSGIPQTLLTTVSGFGQNRNFTVSDFNDDGLLDIGYYEHLTGNIIYRPSKGMSFSSTDHSMPFVFSIYDETAQVQSSDYNGDGLTDFILYTELANEQYAYSTQGKHADLLAKSKNGLGGETAFVYGSSIYYDNSYLPFNFPVITAVSVSNGLGNEYATAYSYGQGLWNAGEREFYGFGYAKITDPEGSYAESYFRQDNVYMRGRPDRQEQYDAEGNLYTKTTNTWVTEDIYPSTTPPVKFVKLSRSDNYVYDGDSSGKRTAQEFYYEEPLQLGNLTKTVQLGEVNIDTGADTGTDKRTVETLYLNNTSGDNWLIGLPYDITIKNNDNDIVRRSWMYYDYHAGLTDVPVKGLLTKEEKWGGSSGNPETEFSYDAYGNLLTATDP
ncbi:MAG: toxin TcdB middle/N-terminal domain-containing protein, partial [Candidatus Omnitrophota bacterium]